MNVQRWYICAITVLYLVGMLGYESYALIWNDTTISRMVWTLVDGKPWLSAILCVLCISAFGLLMGHFFWQAKR